MKKYILSAALLVVFISLAVVVKRSFFSGSLVPEKKVTAEPAQQTSSCGLQNANETFDQCTARIKSLDVSQADQIYLSFSDKFKKPDDPANNIEQYMFLGLMPTYFACKIGGDKDGATSGFEKYIDSIKNMPPGTLTNFKDEFQEMAAGKLQSVYFNLYDNIALGDVSRICPDEFPAYCTEFLNNGSRISNGKASNGLDVKNIGSYCQSSCQRLTTYAANKQAGLKDLADPTVWGGDVVFGNPYNTIAAVAYRLGGKDLALKQCDADGISADSRNKCQTAVYGMDMLNKSCDDVTAALANFVCQQEKNVAP